ncbi:MAG: 23S rRNA (adenine(2503)-C(2))-methyltransferase RlmN [Phycisphaerae bacterium]
MELSLPVISQTPPPTEPPRAHLLGMDQAQLEQRLAERGEKKFRAAQILEWIYRRGESDFEAMSNLSKDLRTMLSREAAVFSSTITRESVADDGTTKLLVEWPDRQSVEAVWIPANERNTACISSQVGCPVGCRFCASGLDGVERNLTAGEIVEQAMQIRRRIHESLPPEERGQRPAPAARRESPSPRHLSATGDRLSNIVMMGMGEPLANYAAAIQAVKILNAPWGMGIGARKITLSTVGLPAQIRKLAEEGLQINLALSLHATDDQLRHELIPWGKGVPIEDLLDACWYFFEKTGREVTFEYVLLAGVNDHPEHARLLASMAKRVRANVNLLRYNPVAGTPYKRPSSEAAYDFQTLLRDRGVNVHMRTSRGMNADAACGQLRRKAMTGTSSE